MQTKIFGLLVILLIISVVPVANAQISFGEKAVQKSVEVTINSAGDVHVKHVIKPVNIPKQVELVYGTVSNILVTNEQGEEQQFSVIGDNNGVLMMPTDQNSILEYDLDDVLVQKNNVWTWSFRYLETTNFIFPKEVDLVYVNDRTVFLDNKKGITCHGCEMLLEYTINEPQIFKNIKWEDKEFVVEIRGYTNIDNFIFDQPTKSITFDISDGGRYVNTIIPLKLLWEPYTILQDDEPIFFRDFNNGTHVWLNYKPDAASKIMIVGTTVVPEFPIFAPLAVGFLMIVLVPFIQKFNLR